MSFGLDWIEDEHSGNISRVIAGVYLKYLHGEMPNRNYTPDDVYADLVTDYPFRPKIVRNHKDWWMKVVLFFLLSVATCLILYFSGLLFVLGIVLIVCFLFRQLKYFSARLLLWLLWARVCC